MINPTGLAFSPGGEMFISSRYDGTVYRVTPFKEAEEFARNLGIATGIAFDSEGRMFVGDRSGTIYQVNEIGEGTSVATLEASMARCRGTGEKADGSDWRQRSPPMRSAEGARS